MSKAQYFFAFPKLASISPNANKNSISAAFNCENPLKRERDEKNFETKSKSTDTKPDYIPYPSSYFPDILFKNTVPHPYLIFFNLYRKDLEIENDGYDVQDIYGSFISQLNEYFGVKDILMHTSAKNDFTKISETWNNRFPAAKSSSFSPVREDFRIEDMLDIQSLHFLAFQLNANFYLIFKIDSQKAPQYYNMKLGPDSSDYDIHFLVHENIDKTGVPYTTKDNKTVIIYKHEKWLSLELIEISHICDNMNVPFQKFEPDSGVLFLELERRDPIPFISIPSVKNNFNEIKFSCKKITNNESFKCAISFTMPKKKEDNKKKESNKKKKEDNNVLQVCVITNDKFNSKISKIKSIATGKFKSENKHKETGKFKFDHFFFAETNRSAFLVNENEENVSDKNFALEIFRDGNDKPKMSFPPINDNIEEKIREVIISYRERLKYPYTYGEIASSKHPLIFILCTYNILNIMLKSADYINEDLNRNTVLDDKHRIRVFPIENDDIFFSYRDIKDCNPITAKNETNEDRRNEIVNEWKKLADSYPQLMPSTASIYGNSKYVNDIKRYYKEDNPLFGIFFFSLGLLQSNYSSENSGTFQMISNKTIKHLRENKIGLNPIITPVIYREFMQLSKTCCIYYFSNKKYIKPVNESLMRDIQTVKEFKSRTTVQIFKDEAIVEENAKLGAFPIKKQSFIKMLEMKGNKPIPDPSFDFNESKNEELYNAIIDCEGTDLKSFEPNFKYQFYPINNGEIIYNPQFAISSYYQLKYIYVSRDNVYSVGVSEKKTLDSNMKFEFAYGKCKTLDTEVQFEEPIKGKFKGAVYLEENSCLIICYEVNDQGITKCYFTGYDKQGKINESNFDFTDEVKSVTFISRTYFATYNGSPDFNDGVSVFKYNPKDRIIEYNKYADNWRITKSNFGRARLCETYLQNEANRENGEYQPCFIGSQFSYGSKSSTFCIYKYDNKKYSLNKAVQKDNPNQPMINLLSETEYRNADDQDEESNLLDIRFDGKTNVIIPSMFNVLPLDKKKIQFTPLDLFCAICELFPTPISINDRIVTFSEQKQLSLFICDYKVYRVLSDQIYGFYINTISRINLFAIESLVKAYNFKNTNIAIIADTCGIGAKFSNMFYGTRFDEKNVLNNEIWSGFSYSEKYATIILIFRINDLESLYNAINKEKISPAIFFCKKEGIKYSIKFGLYKELIKIGDSNKSSSQYTEITFVSNTEFQNNVVSLRSNYLSNYKSKKNNSSNAIDTLSTSDAISALSTSKDIVTRYLTFNTFTHYPLETVELYAKREIQKKTARRIGDYLNLI